MMKKIIKITLFSLISIITLSAITISSSTYLTRWSYHLFRFGVYDYKFQPTNTISCSSTPHYFETEIKSNKGLFSNLDYYGEKIDDFDEFLASHSTTAFLILKNDTLIYENYFNGHSRDTLCKSFSMTKTFLSALVGIAIEEGHIKSIDEPIKRYFPELKGEGLDDLTIRHCLLGKSGFKYRKGAMPWYEQPRMYYSTDVREYLRSVELSNNPGTVWRTTDISPLLLGLVLEKATKTTISNYLEEKLWKPLGMESDALLVVDSEENKFEKMESGLVAKPIDLLKFGSLYLHNGNWNSKQIVPKEWVTNSTKPDSTSYFHENNYYRYFWWGFDTENDNYEFTAKGHFFQRIYVSPHNNIVVVRLGTDAAGVNWSKFIFETIKSVSKGH